MIPTSFPIRCSSINTVSPIQSSQKTKSLQEMVHDFLKSAPKNEDMLSSSEQPIANYLKECCLRLFTKEKIIQFIDGFRRVKTEVDSLNRMESGEYFELLQHKRVAYGSGDYSKLLQHQCVAYGIVLDTWRERETLSGFAFLQRVDEKFHQDFWCPDLQIASARLTDLEVLRRDIHLLLADIDGRSQVFTQVSIESAKVLLSQLAKAENLYTNYLSSLEAKLKDRLAELESKSFPDSESDDKVGLAKSDLENLQTCISFLNDNHVNVLAVLRGAALFLDEVLKLQRVDEKSHQDFWHPDLQTVSVSLTDLKNLRGDIHLLLADIDRRSQVFTEVSTEPAKVLRQLARVLHANHLSSLKAKLKDRSESDLENLQTCISFLNDNHVNVLAVLRGATLYLDSIADQGGIGFSVGCSVQ